MNKPMIMKKKIYILLKKTTETLNINDKFFIDNNMIGLNVRLTPSTFNT